jgi:hypothetical protein
MAAAVLAMRRPAQLGHTVRDLQEKATSRSWPLVRAYKAGGAAALVSKKRGRSSGRQLSTALRQLTVSLVREHYADFGPTLAHEKLVGTHGVKLSVETLRQWMIAEGIWLPRRQRTSQPHPPRRRRACLGELVQIDGCDHEWFESRAPRCTLTEPERDRRFVAAADVARALGPRG